MKKTLTPRTTLVKDFALQNDVPIRRVSLMPDGTPYILSADTLAEINEKLARNRATQRAKKAHTQQQVLKEKVALRLWEEVKERARLKEQNFRLTPEDINIPLECPAFKVSLNLKALTHPDWAPVVIRKDPSKGWVVGNVAVLSRRAARIFNHFSTDELANFGRWSYYNLTPKEI